MSHRWSPREIHELRVLFKDNLLQLACPGTYETELMLQTAKKDGMLIGNRHVEKIHNKVVSMILQLQSHEELRDKLKTDLEEDERLISEEAATRQNTLDTAGIVVIDF